MKSSISGKLIGNTDVAKDKFERRRQLWARKNLDVKQIMPRPKEMVRFGFKVTLPVRGMIYSRAMGRG